MPIYSPKFPTKTVERVNPYPYIYTFRDVVEPTYGNTKNHIKHLYGNREDYMIATYESRSGLFSCSYVELRCTHEFEIDSDLQSVFVGFKKEDVICEEKPIISGYWSFE